MIKFNQYQVFEKFFKEGVVLMSGISLRDLRHLLDLLKEAIKNGKTKEAELRLNADMLEQVRKIELIDTTDDVITYKNKRIYFAGNKHRHKIFSYCTDKKKQYIIPILAPETGLQPLELVKSVHKLIKEFKEKVPKSSTLLIWTTSPYVLTIAEKSCKFLNVKLSSVVVNKDNEVMYSDKDPWHAKQLVFAEFNTFLGFLEKLDKKYDKKKGIESES